MLLKKDGFVLKHVSDTIKNDKDVVLAAVQQDGYTLEYASPDLQKDEEVLAAVKQNASILQYTSEELKKNKQFLLECYRINKDTIKYSNFIDQFDKLENGLFDDEFIKENTDIVYLVKNKKYKTIYDN